MTTSTAQTPSGIIGHAAALFDGVARDSESGADYEVPIRCGQAANALHALLGAAPTRIPLIDDDATSIAAALQSAITDLESLPPQAALKPVVEALAHARAAMASLADGPAR